MYNEELKKQFIKDDVTNRNFDKFMTRYFETAEKLEEEYQKDLCNFNIQEIENYFVGLSTASLERCQNIKAQFIKYCQYCQERNLIDDNQIHWQEVDSIFIKRTLNMGKQEELFVTRKQLLKDLAHFNNASDAFIVLAIFEGLCGNKYSDLYHLDIKQFRKSNGKIFVDLEDKTLEVSDKLFELGSEASIVYERLPNSPDATKSFMLNKEDPYIIKRTMNSSTDSIAAFMHNLSSRLTVLKRDFDLPYCSQSGLINSGRLHYIYEHSNKGKIDVEQVLRDNYEDITRLYGRIQVKKNMIEQYNRLYGREE